jgi:hypothetical protein
MDDDDLEPMRKLFSQEEWPTNYGVPCRVGEVDDNETVSTAFAVGWNFRCACKRN